VTEAGIRHWDPQARARELDASGRHVGGPPDHWSLDGRFQLIALLRRGLNPDSHVVDVGCGALRAGYWLIHFLEPGRYHGIDPMKDNVDAARAAILEPGLEAAKQPAFAYNDDFDIGVFGVSPDFVLARSVWSHAPKSQIQALLDSFAAKAAEDALMLSSYLPAMDPNDRAAARRSPVDRLLGRRAAHNRRRYSKRPDYNGTEWAGWGPGSDATDVLIAHSFNWIVTACRERGLAVAESRQDEFGGQVWLEIKRA
jgi:SAM-dependent methyltransferase